jgi:hypothetical protein
MVARMGLIRTSLVAAFIVQVCFLHTQSYPTNQENKSETTNETESSLTSLENLIEGRRVSVQTVLGAHLQTHQQFVSNSRRE